MKKKPSSLRVSVLCAAILIPWGAFAVTSSAESKQLAKDIKINAKSIAQQLPTKPVNFSIHAPAQVGRNWLRLLDQGKYEESWNQASMLVKKNVKKVDFIRHAERSRLPLGTLKDRKIKLIQPANKLPGAPEGQYLLMTFTTYFHNKEQAVTEMVMLQKDPDNQWRVAGYFIQ